MIKRKETKGQTMICKTLYKKLKTEQNDHTMLMLPTTKIKKNKKKHTKKNTKKTTKATLHRKIKIEQKHKTILTLQKKRKKKKNTTQKA